MDCSLSMGPNGKPALLADQGYEPRKKRPWIYVGWGEAAAVFVVLLIRPCWVWCGWALLCCAVGCRVNHLYLLWLKPELTSALCDSHSESRLLAGGSRVWYCQQWHHA